MKRESHRKNVFAKLYDLICFSPLWFPLLIIGGKEAVVQLGFNDLAAYLTSIGI